MNNLDFKTRSTALREVKRRELRAMTDDEALRVIDTLQSMPASLVWRSPRRAFAEGLITRQKLLYKIP